LGLEELASKLEVSLFRIATQAIRHDLVEIDKEFLIAVNSYYS
jgi:predicted transcriptional regulator